MSKCALSGEGTCQNLKVLKILCPPHMANDPSLKMSFLNILGYVMNYKLIVDTTWYVAEKGEHGEKGEHSLM